MYTEPHASPATWPNLDHWSPFLFPLHQPIPLLSKSQNRVLITGPAIHCKSSLTSLSHFLLLHLWPGSSKLRHAVWAGHFLVHMTLSDLRGPRGWRRREDTRAWGWLVKSIDVKSPCLCILVLSQACHLVVCISKPAWTTRWLNKIFNPHRVIWTSSGWHYSRRSCSAWSLLFRHYCNPECPHRQYTWSHRPTSSHGVRGHGGHLCFTRWWISHRHQVCAFHALLWEGMGLSSLGCVCDQQHIEGPGRIHW